MKTHKTLSALLAACILAGSCLPTASVQALTPRPYGDVNLDSIVDVSDAVLIARYCIMDPDAEIREEGKSLGDVNLDGKLNEKDMTQILEFIARKRTVLGTKEVQTMQYNAVNLMDSIQASVPESKAADQTFIDSQMKLTVDLFKGAAQDAQSEGKDLLISPLSVSQALAMTTNGAKGQTKEEMEKLLGDKLDIDALNKYYASYTNALKKTDELHLANSLWIKEGYVQVPDAFLQTTKDYYGADAFTAPFDDTTVTDVNNWVNLNTDEMIPELIDEMNPEWIMLLINALAFEADWATPYFVSDVHESTFHAYDGDMQASMMSGTEHTYLQDDKATGFIKQYKDGRYSFAAILPNKDITVSDYISEMTGESLADLLNSQSHETVYTLLPKFKYDYSIKMNDMLKALGMKTAFIRGIADFTGLNALGETFVDLVLHKTFIQVDELGTKAGAVTMVAMAGNGMMREPKEVYLDRPFIYMILDNETNLPIFIGYVLHPIAGDAE